jgi:hypothetical protein
MTTYRKVDVWCDNPDHGRDQFGPYDHPLTENCIRPRTFDSGGPPDVTVMPPPDDRAQGPTWADGVFSEERPWPEADHG